jgi:hypothetical protein
MRTFNNADLRKIIGEYLDDVVLLGESEDYHDLEEFAYQYGGLLPDKTFVDCMEFLLKYFTLQDQGV